MAIEVDLALTNNCNLHCKHCCYSSGGNNFQNMSYEVIENALRQLRAMGADELHLAGGEPFTRGDLIDIVKLGKKLGYKVQVLTNGFNIPLDMFKKLKNAGLDRILFSIDDFGEYHNQFRGHEKVFESVIQSINYAKSVNFFVRVNTVVTNESMGRMPQLNQYLDQIGVNKQSFFVLTPIGRGTQLNKIAPNLMDWYNFKRLMRQYAEQKKPLMVINAQKLYSSYAGGEKVITTCRINRRDDCVIAATGDVYPCYIYASTNKKLGNIMEEDISKIWMDDSRWEQYYEWQTQNCSRCSGLMCNGGCTGYIETVNGNMVDCDKRCLIEKGLVPDCVRIYEQIWDGANDF